MTIQRLDHVGIVVDDLAAATEFFVELGLVLQGEASLEGSVVDRLVGREGVRTDVAFVQTPDGHGRLELIKFHSPSDQGDNRQAAANTPGIRHVTFAVDDIDAAVAACETGAPSSSASWCNTRTATSSATSAARRGSSSSWRRRSANGSAPFRPDAFGPEPDCFTLDGWASRCGRSRRLMVGRSRSRSGVNRRGSRSSRCMARPVSSCAVATRGVVRRSGRVLGDTRSCGVWEV